MRRYGNADARLEDVVRFVNTLHTWMHPKTDDERVEFATRENGDVGTERAGRADVAEGFRVAKELRKRFPDANVDYDVVDEWVIVAVDFRSKRYKSKELARALQAAFPSIGTIREMGGTWEMAMGVVPGIGVVRLSSDMSSGGLLLDHIDNMHRSPHEKAVKLEGLEPRAIQNGATK